MNHPARLQLRVSYALPHRKGTPDYSNDVVTLRLESGSDSVLAERWDAALLVAAGARPRTPRNGAIFSMCC